MNSKSNLHEKHHNGKEKKEKVPLNARSTLVTHKWSHLREGGGGGGGGGYW